MKFTFILAATLIQFATSTLTAVGQENVGGDSLAEYVVNIAKIQNDLDAGRIDAATKSLASTPAALRDFEYEYLTARLEDAVEGTPAPDRIQQLPRPEVESRYAVLNEMNRQLVFICRNGSLHIHDLDAPKAEAKVVSYDAGGAIWTGDFTHDGTRFFSGHSSGEVLVRDTKTWEIVKQIDLHSLAPVRELAASPDGSAMVAEAKEGLELWSLADEMPTKIANFGERYNFGEGLAFSPTGDKFATGGMFDLLIHDAKTGAELQTLSHASYTMGLEFSPDGKFIASAPRGNVNKFFAVFDLSKSTQLFNAGPFGNYVAGMAFTPSGNRVAATGCEKKIRVFDSATGKVALTLPRPECGSKPAFTRDGRVFGWNEPAGFMYIDLGERALQR